MKKLFLLLFLNSLFLQAQEISTKTVEYKDGETILEGYSAFNPSLKGKNPAVLVIHEWTGINDNIKSKCDKLAKMGYVVLAADIYGKGIRPENPQDAGKEAGKYKNNRDLMRQRATAGLNTLKAMDNVDPSKIAVIGYCFGGTAALELARSGAPLTGVISFHGGLDFPNPADTKNIKAKVLICHGAIDPNVPKEQVDAFLKEMNDAKIDYQFIAYSGAVHAFTNPKAGNDISKGVAYNKEADMRSWEAMKTFFNEIFIKN